jgi:hypothetical protein
MFRAGLVSQKATFSRGKTGVEGRQADRSHQWDAFNLGEVSGLTGVWSLAPLVFVWLVLGGYVVRPFRLYSTGEDSE